MKIALYGATGQIGGQILQEAWRRGHSVTAIVRDPAWMVIFGAGLTIVQGDATDPESVAQLVKGHDVVIGSISGRRDHDAGKIAEAARSLISGTAKAGVKRLLWVGGASSLEVAPGLRLIDAPGFPDEYRAEALAGIEAL